MRNMVRGVASYNDVLALEKIPLTNRKLPSSILEALRHGQKLAEHRDALVFIPDANQPQKTFRWSFPELISQIEQTAAGFQGLTPGRPPVVAILLPNLPETHFAIWGAQSVGVASPINPLLEPGQIAEILKSVAADVIVTLAPLPGTDLFNKAVSAARMSSSVKTIVTVNPVRYAPFLKSLVGRLLSAFKQQAGGIEVRTFPSILADPSRLNETLRSGDDVGAYFHTGGTTGAPKIAQLTHANQVFVGWAAAANRFLEKNKSFFCGLPLFHVNGVLVTGLVTWMNGATVVLGPPQGFRALGVIENFWRLVDIHQIGAFSAVPTIYKMLIDYPVGDNDVSSLEFAICGAAPISKATLEEFVQRTGITILEGYGCTESACIASINPGYGDQRFGTVGLRLPYQDIAIFTEDGKGEMKIASPQEIGVVALKGPNVFAGYLNADDDEYAWIVDDGQRWYNTGDLGRLDADGFLTLTGRKKELIIRGGHNIDPAIIEDALHADKGICFAAAIGSPDPRVGEVPVAYISLVEGAVTNEEAVLARVEKLISERAAIPKRITILDEMPLTAVGKIFKPELKRQEVDRVIKDILARTSFGHDIKVETTLHPQFGPTAKITVQKESFSESQGLEVRQALYHYTFKWEIERV